MKLVSVPNFSLLTIQLQKSIFPSGWPSSSHDYFHFERKSFHRQRKNNITDWTYYRVISFYCKRKREKEEKEKKKNNLVFFNVNNTFPFSLFPRFNLSFRLFNQIISRISLLVLILLTIFLSSFRQIVILQIFALRYHICKTPFDHSNANNKR